MVDIFISYRRTQVFLIERIHDRMCSIFNADQIFLDRSEIKSGDVFPKKIIERLTKSKIVIAVIDPTWISIQDTQTFRRRIEMETDWVRMELEDSLASDKIVIPVLIDGAKMPTKEQLPDSLAALADRQFLEVSRERFADDVDGLIRLIKTRISESELRELLDDESHPYPKAGEFKPIAIEGDLLEKMMAELPHWQLLESPLHDDPRPGTPEIRLEIVRSFRFPTFLAAVRFMSEAAKPIDVFGHHPRWENVFKTVRVSLSTWDIGHRPSDRDFKSAIMLERFYERFVERRANAQ